MRVIAVDRKGPKVRGFFALATEIHDDSGARKFSRRYTNRAQALTESSPYTRTSSFYGEKFRHVGKAES